MEVASTTSASAVSTTAPVPTQPSSTNDSGDETLKFDPSLSEEEKRFYIRAYPNVDLVRERKVHCTTCKIHVGTAPAQAANIRMHPILRVTHCLKCHDFYNSGEFSKGEDGSELYCRWCGQGGEVYCCSSCPYVFCKSCIVKNLSRGVVVDIEQNENWNCFSCAPKILWPLRAQHWALIRYIEKQKKFIETGNHSEYEKRSLFSNDRSTCCRLAKAKCGNMSDSLESLDSTASRRSHGSAGGKKQSKSPGSSSHTPPAKRAKTSNDDIVCTPDLLSMLEPDCQLTVQQKGRPSAPSTSTPKVISLPTNHGGLTIKAHTNTPPPLVLRNTGLPMRHPSPAPVVRRTVIGARNNTPAAGSHTPVYHTINGYRIDLNSAAQQETFRLPNGKLIQVKRQGTNASPTGNQSPTNNNPWMRQPSPITTLQHAAAGRPIQITPASPHATQHYYTVQNQQQQQNTMHHPQMLRYSNTTVTPIGGQNGAVRNAQIQVVNGIPVAPTATPTGAQQSANVATAVRAPLMIRHVFPDTAIGQARNQLQDQVFNAMEICQHLTGKVQTLTNSNAYKQARNYLEVKELYIHLSYLLTYAIGRFKGLQDKCLGDMRQLGFVNDADSLENGQLAAGVDYVRYGQLEDIDLFNISANSFHNQVYEYRKSLYANLEKGEDGDEKKPPLSPLMPLGQHKRNGADGADADEDEDNDEDFGGATDNDTTCDNSWMRGNDTTRTTHMNSTAYNETDQSYYDNGDGDEMGADVDMDDDDFDNDGGGGGGGGGRSGGNFGQYSSSQQSSSYYVNKAHYGTEDYMSQEEETHARDRKLARLVQQYPSIWCTRHPDYGNFEVTRKHWNTVASHFKRTENIKLRWKNIRKRYVRVERRVREGKRFNGYFDKTTNFLANRELPQDQWVEVDCGSDNEGEAFTRTDLDAVEKKLNKLVHQPRADDGGDNDFALPPLSENPIEIRALDLKIINFVKCNPVLWRKSGDSQYNHIDEQSRKSLWTHLWKGTRLPDVSCEDIIDRWTHLYEMYKSFRLKTIKDENRRATMEVKYSKYLAKLYFLYKIVEDELRNEDLNNIDIDLSKDMPENDKRLQDEPDDKEFLQNLVRSVQRYPMLWDKLNIDYYDTILRENIWQDIASELKDYKHKQASDDEDNEIEIVEPHTDTITLDSDNEEDEVAAKKATSSPNKPLTVVAQNSSGTELLIAPSSTTNAAAATTTTANSNARGITVNKPADKMEEMDIMSAARTFLVSLLEVDSDAADAGSDSSQQKPKQPRKKTTNKPNPTLLKQKEMLERERLEEMKRNDQKLKMKCEISLKKAEEEFPFAKDMLEKHESISKTEREAKDKENAEKMETDAEEVEDKDEKETSSGETTKENIDQNESGELEILTVELESSAEGGKEERAVVMVEADKSSTDKSESEDNSKQFTIVMGGDEDDDDDDDDDGNKGKSLIIEVEGSSANENNKNKPLEVLIDAKEVEENDDKEHKEVAESASDEKTNKDKVETVSECARRVIESVKASEKKAEMEKKEQQTVKDDTESATKTTPTTTNTDKEKDTSDNGDKSACAAADDTIEPIMIEDTDIADSIESPTKISRKTICDEKEVETEVVVEAADTCAANKISTENSKASEENKMENKTESVMPETNNDAEEEKKKGDNVAVVTAEPPSAAAELNEPEIDVEKEIEALLSKVPEETAADEGTSGPKTVAADAIKSTPKEILDQLDTEMTTKMTTENTTETPAETITAPEGTAATIAAPEIIDEIVKELLESESPAAQT